MRWGSECGKLDPARKINEKIKGDEGGPRPKENEEDGEKGYKAISGWESWKYF